MKQNLILFPWEQKEYLQHVEQMHNERRQKRFALDGIVRIAKAINETDPITAGELLDLAEDTIKQIGSTGRSK